MLITLIETDYIIVFCCLLFVFLDIAKKSSKLFNAL